MKIYKERTARINTTIPTSIANDIGSRGLHFNALLLIGYRIANEFPDDPESAGKSLKHLRARNKQLNSDISNINQHLLEYRSRNMELVRRINVLEQKLDQFEKVTMKVREITISGDLKGKNTEIDKILSEIYPNKK